MVLRLRWSAEAVEDLDAIAEYIARDSLVYARSVVSGIMAAAKKVGVYPQIGRVVPEIGNSTIRELLVFSYRLIYRIELNCITMLAVVHGRKVLTKAIDFVEKESES